MGIFSIIIALLLLYSIVSVLRLAYHPDLAKIPGPFLSRFSNISVKLATLTGTRSKYIHSLHLRYGPYVRITPIEISTSSIVAYRQIHRIGTDFIKAPWYQQQSPAQYSDDTCAVFGLRGPKVTAERRRLFLQAGSKSAVSVWEETIVSFIKAAVEKIQRDAENGTANIATWWSLMTSDVLSTMAFGESFHMIEREEKTQMMHDIEQALIFAGARMELPWLWYLVKYIPLPSIGRPVDLVHRFTAYGQLALKNTKAAKPGSAKTIFSKMMPEDGSQKIPDSVIVNESANIIIAGADTVAIALTYVVFAVLSNPEIKAKLIDELDTCSPEPTWEELETKPYLNRVITETLRLYSPVPASLPRVAPNGTVLEGYRIPGFAVVDTQAYTFHQDERVFPEPERFNPDRWIDPTPEMKEYYQPWGGSSRICVGQNTARCELLHATALFFRKCPSARLAEGTNEKTMDWFDFFMIKPKGGRCDITMKPE